MILFLSSRRTATLLMASTAISFLPTFTSVVIAFPGVIGGGGGTVISANALAPLLLAILTARSLSTRYIHLNEGAVRGTGWMDSALIICVLLLIAALSLFLPSGDLTMARNAALLVGISSIVASQISPAAGVAAVTTFVLVVVTYGRSAPGSRFVRVLQSPADNLWSIFLAVVLILFTLICLLPRKSLLSTLSGSSGARGTRELN